MFSQAYSFCAFFLYRSYFDLFASKNLRIFSLSKSCIMLRALPKRVIYTASPVCTYPVSCRYGSYPAALIFFVRYSIVLSNVLHMILFHLFRTNKSRHDDNSNDNGDDGKPYKNGHPPLKGGFLGQLGIFFLALDHRLCDFH